MGGRGSSGGGGKGRSGGGITRSGSIVQTPRGTYQVGESVEFNKTDTRYTIQGTGERIYRSSNSIIDTGETVTNPDGTVTRTYIQRGNKGNTYVVKETYREEPRRFGEGAGRVYTIRTTINRTTKR